MVSRFSKFIAVGVLAATFTTLAATDAEAQRRHHRRGGHGAGPAIALGIGAIALGAMIASQNQPAYYQPQYGAYDEGYYHAPRPRFAYRWAVRYDDWGQPYRVRVRCQIGYNC